MKISLYKNLVLLIIFLGTNFVCAQHSSSNELDSLIFWSESELLTWNDFKKNKKREINKNAISEIGLRFIPVFNNDVIHRLEVLPFFDKKVSRTNIINDYVLKHEQFHFNIAELYARKIRKYFKVMHDKKQRIKDYQLVIDRFKIEYYSYQNNYDRITKHGASLKEQKNWEKKINLELEHLKYFKLNI